MKSFIWQRVKLRANRIEGDKQDEQARWQLWRKFNFLKSKMWCEAPLAHSWWGDGGGTHAARVAITFADGLTTYLCLAVTAPARPPAKDEGTPSSWQLLLVAPFVSLFVFVAAFHLFCRMGGSQHHIPPTPPPGHPANPRQSAGELSPG